MQDKQEMVGNDDVPASAKRHASSEEDDGGGLEHG
jgi:hypothetical protein